MIQIREYRASYMPLITSLIYKTVHAISNKFYSEEEKNAWMPEAFLEKEIPLKYTLVCFEGEELVGFVDFDEKNGFINYLYTSPEHQRKGIASMLYAKIEERMRMLGLYRISARASKAAVAFFEKKGLDIRWENEIMRQGIVLTNYTMSKNL
ncbi:putative acetyltransferase [Dysgonomonas sp. PH5-45]|uniref:GNAT family N-acetyltransferase n=1 Tax=unclassified Dysgonomonas TaxID=2630389 RepID=UPI002477150B|nr:MULTISPECIES: GNAT family N-acetyltransferase [unclassified Dysgonomonas]MDH6354945.1 putative acetyltransferase [Dysgonomonas sp. PH5-45]MDH6387844.1 putative acetyltransferase [Dysgonomonas sp. PH5-37]